MRSMTGFGRGESSSPDGAVKICAEISTVNRKQLEIRVSLPREISFLEPTVRNLVRRYLSRGAVNMKILLTLSEDVVAASVKLNQGFIGAVLRQAVELNDKFALNQPLELKDILTLPGAFEEAPMELDDEILTQITASAVELAAQNVVAMREDEGKNMKTDIQARLKTIQECVEQVKGFAPQIPLLQRQKLQRKLEEAGLPLDLDDERIMRELVIYADKADVAEELTRLDSHFIQFDKYLNLTETPVGRSMDFIIQEMNREITTLGNKAGNSNISPLVVTMKTELEKIREQVQNIE